MATVNKEESSGTPIEEKIEDEGSPIEERAEDAATPIEVVEESSPEAPKEEVVQEPKPEIEEKKSPYVVGIDLGTSTSSIAVFDATPGIRVKDAAKVLSIEGSKFMPSVVHVMPEGGEILVGEQAKDMMLIDPENTVASIKREMGDPSYCKEFEGIENKKFSPADISAEILKKLVQEATSNGQFDFQGPVIDAVICVPANFEDNKKRMTEQAGQLAGLNILETLHEPIAAAIAYGAANDADQKIMVYDLGGGTFDVSILEVRTKAQGDATDGDKWKARFRVLASEGIPKLGGDDFDKRMMQLVQDRFCQKTGLDLDLFDLGKDQCGGVNKRTLRHAEKKLKQACERAKEELTQLAETEIRIVDFMKDGKGDIHGLEEKIRREEFEDAIRDLIASSEAAVHKALDSAKLKIDDIDRIILVGGSTRVPLVKQMIEEMFGKPTYTDPDPDTAVARGAAIWGDWLSQPKGPGVGIELINQVTHHLGIALHGGKFHILIEKGRELSEEAPEAAVEQEFVTSRDNMTSMKIEVFQSSDQVEYVSDEPCTYVANILLDGIPPAAKGKERVKVSFAVDRQNRLRVHATCLSDGAVTKSLDNIKIV
ncbi:MAG: Hsp70 family protein [Desulfomonile tiedjei]|uniref:Hsp70 family protein n=1 Tax=Desulfomonile tiedjei TaxID=2358 RepID=A0A9D6Z670_9BACT|nr:Hsp70 family protein [Desulfomonile tiedjei]